MSATFYRGFRIEYDPPPIPVRIHDWSWAHEDYDGPGDSRCGTSPSLEAAKAAIDDWYEEYGFSRHVVTDHCSRCGQGTSFEWAEGEGWLSVCCSAREKPLPADLEPDQPTWVPDAS